METRKYCLASAPNFFKRDTLILYYVCSIYASHLIAYSFIRTRAECYLGVVASRAAPDASPFVLSVGTTTHSNLLYSH